MIIVRSTKRIMAYFGDEILLFVGPCLRNTCWSEFSVELLCMEKRTLSFILCLLSRFVGPGSGH